MSDRATIQLRKLLAQPGCVVAPGIADAFAARLVKLAKLQSMKNQLRAVVVVEDSISDRELEAMHALAVRGIRFNVVNVATEKGVLPMDAVRRMAEICFGRITRAF